MFQFKKMFTAGVLLGLSYGVGDVASAGAPRLDAPMMRLSSLKELAWGPGGAPWLAALDIQHGSAGLLNDRIRADMPVRAGFLSSHPALTEGLTANEPRGMLPSILRNLAAAPSGRIIRSVDTIRLLAGPHDALLPVC